MKLQIRFSCLENNNISPSMLQQQEQLTHVHSVLNCKLSNNLSLLCLNLLITIEIVMFPVKNHQENHHMRRINPDVLNVLGKNF